MFKRPKLRCSFCGKKDTEVAKLVAGPRVYICDGCVAIASRIIASDSDQDGEALGAKLSLWRRVLARTRQFFRAGNAQRVKSPALSSHYAH
jgi:ATP-dependent protease Clp ATPase subunit